MSREDLLQQLNEYKEKYLREKIKNDIYLDIIKNNTTIKLSEIITKTKVITNQPKTEEIKNNLVLIKEGFKSAKYYFNLQGENNIVLKLQSEQDITDINHSINVLIKQLIEAKKISIILKKIKLNRNRLLSIINLDIYTSILNDNNKDICDILKHKGYSEPKSNTFLIKSLSPLDMRLIRIDKYHDYMIETDDLDLLKEFNLNNNKHIQVFSISKLFAPNCNYSLALLNIKDVICNLLFCKNVIYLPLENNKSEPYSFYLLDSVQNNKNYWTMDCRLEYLLTNIIDNFVGYLVTLFKQLYFDVFKDNVYRKNYKESCQLMEYDCEQLLRNIFFLLDNVKMKTFIFDFVIKNNSYTPKNNDYFNIFEDDNIQRKRSNSITIYKDISKILFDNISEEDEVVFYNNYKNNN